MTESAKEYEKPDIFNRNNWKAKEISSTSVPAFTDLEAILRPRTNQADKENNGKRTRPRLFTGPINSSSRQPLATIQAIIQPRHSKKGLDENDENEDSPFRITGLGDKWEAAKKRRIHFDSTPGSRPMLGDKEYEVAEVSGQSGSDQNCSKCGLLHDTKECNEFYCHCMSHAGHTQIACTMICKMPDHKYHYAVDCTLKCCACGSKDHTGRRCRGSAHLDRKRKFEDIFRNWLSGCPAMQR